MQVNTNRSLPPSVVSVVVIGRNEGERLGLCLASVLRTNYPIASHDLIYVDSCSSDDSCALARTYGFRVLSLAGSTTAARARNLGWTNVKTDLILFLDGDTVLHVNFLREAAAFFTNPEVAGVFGVREESHTRASVYNAIFDMDWPQKTGPADYFGGDALVRTSALKAVDGYDPSLIAGEEPDLCRRIRALGYSILRIAQPMTLHDLAMTRFDQYWRRSIRTGHAYAEVSARYRHTPDPLWSAQSRSNILRGTFWLTMPCIAVSVAMRGHSAWAIAASCLVAAATMFRSARHAYREGSLLKVSLAYGLHSQLQHIPILLGQLRYLLSRQGGPESTLIEYK